MVGVVEVDWTQDSALVCVQAEAIALIEGVACEREGVGLCGAAVIGEREKAGVCDADLIVVRVVVHESAAAARADEVVGAVGAYRTDFELDVVLGARACRSCRRRWCRSSSAVPTTRKMPPPRAQAVTVSVGAVGGDGHAGQSCVTKDGVNAAAAGKRRSCR